MFHQNIRNQQILILRSIPKIRFHLPVSGKQTPNEGNQIKKMMQLKLRIPQKKGMLLLLYLLPNKFFVLNVLQFFDDDICQFLCASDGDLPSKNFMYETLSATFSYRIYEEAFNFCNKNHHKICNIHIINNLSVTTE